jgi:hypothetical protein
MAVPIWTDFNFSPSDWMTGQDDSEDEDDG